MFSRNSKVDTTCPAVRYTTGMGAVMEQFDELSKKIVGQLIEFRKSDDDLFEKILVWTLVGRDV